MTVTYVETRDIPLDQLARFPGNARRGNVAEIQASIARHGQYRSLVVRDTGDSLIILAGNHTRDAIAALGHEAARCEVITCTDDEARRINLADNRLAELGGYDDDALVELLSYLDEDYEGTGWTEEDVQKLLAPPEQLEPAEASDQVPEPPANPITVTGDVWMLGQHRLICGDSRDYETVARLLNGASVNLAFTSPPYASQRAYDPSSGFQPVKPDDYVDWFEDVQANVRATLADDGSWFVNIKEHCENGQRHLYVKDLTLAHVRRWAWLFIDELCWLDASGGFPGAFPNRFKDAWEPVFHFARGRKIKFNPLANGHASADVLRYTPQAHMGMGEHGYSVGGERKYEEGIARPSNVIEIPAGSGGNEHSAAFPVALPAWFIRAYSDPGDTVLDPFMGSGTTLIAAHQENRVAYGVEISPRYCDVICRRWQEHTGEKPRRESDSALVDFSGSADETAEAGAENDDDAPAN